MKTLEEMTKEELYDLCIELMINGAEVQGCEVKIFAEDYDVKW